MRWLLLLLFLHSARAAEVRKFAFEKAEMGIRFTITIATDDAEKARASADAAFARIAELNGIFSDYEDESELSRLSRTHGQRVPVSAELWPVLERAHQLAERSGGAFDITCGPLTALWRRARRKGEVPSAALATELHARCGWRKLALHPAERAAELTAPDMRLDLGAIAKGRACDAALALLRTRGHGAALVAGAGDMAAGDAPPGQRGWRVTVDALNAPGAKAVVVELANCALATSGDRFQRLDAGGQRLSHILDPRSGQPLADHSLVTVIAPDCMTADSLSTTLSVLGPDVGLRLAATYRAEARIQRESGAVESAGWARYREDSQK